MVYAIWRSQNISGFFVLFWTEAMNFSVIFRAFVPFVILKMTFHCAHILSRMIYYIYKTVEPLQPSLSSAHSNNFNISARKLPHFMNIHILSASWQLFSLTNWYFFVYLGWTIEMYQHTHTHTKWCTDYAWKRKKQDISEHTLQLYR